MEDKKAKVEEQQLKAELLKKEGNIWTFQVKKDAAAARKEYEKILKDYKKMAPVPGFRKGKAPLKMVEKLFGSRILPDFLEDKQKEALELSLKTLEEMGVNAINLAPQEAPSWELGEELIVTAKLEVEPEIEAEKYEGLTAEYEEKVLQDSQIDATIEQIREQYAIYEDLEEIQESSTVKIFVEDPEYDDDEEKSKAITFEREIIVGENQFGKQLNESLIGKKADDVFECPLFDPEDKEEDEDKEANAEMQKLRTKSFRITVLSAAKKVLPELNDEFAKDAGYDTLAELRQEIAADEQNKLDRENRRSQQMSIELALIEANPCEIPVSMIQKQAYDMAKEQGEQYGIAPSKLMPSMLGFAEHQLKSYYLLKSVRKQLNPEITDEYKEKMLAEAAKNMNMELSAYKEQYKEEIESEDFMESLKERKVMDILIEKTAFVAPVEKPEEDAEQKEESEE